MVDGTTIEKCCNTCQHRRLHYRDWNITCAIDNDPYQGCLGGHSPDYVCTKWEKREDPAWMHPNKNKHDDNSKEGAMLE